MKKRLTITVNTRIQYYLFLKREREKAFKQCNLQLILHANLIVLQKRNYKCTNLNIKHKQKAFTPLLDNIKKLSNCKKITITHYLTILLII